MERYKKIFKENDISENVKQVAQQIANISGSIVTTEKNKYGLVVKVSQEANKKIFDQMFNFKDDWKTNLDSNYAEWTMINEKLDVYISYSLFDLNPIYRIRTFSSMR